MEPAVAGGARQPGGISGAPTRPEVIPQGQRAEPALVEQPVPGPGPVVSGVQEQRPIAPSEPQAVGPVARQRPQSKNREQLEAWRQDGLNLWLIRLPQGPD